MNQASIPLQQPMTPELLTVEQFAQRLQVSRATIFAWMQKQILVQGQHFFKFGRVLRFTWSDDLVVNLLHESAQSMLITAAAVISVRSVRKKTDTSINWEY